MDARVRKVPGHPMPEMAAFVAELRSVFGDEAIDEGSGGEKKASRPSTHAKWPLSWDSKPRQH